MGIQTLTYGADELKVLFRDMTDYTWAVHIHAETTPAYAVLYTGFTAGEALRVCMIDTLDYQARAQHARIS